MTPFNQIALVKRTWLILCDPPSALWSNITRRKHIYYFFPQGNSIPFLVDEVCIFFILRYTNLHFLSFHWAAFKKSLMLSLPDSNHSDSLCLISRLLFYFKSPIKMLSCQVKYKLPLNQTRKIHLQLKFLIYFQILSRFSLSNVHLIKNVQCQLIYEKIAERLWCAWGLTTLYYFLNFITSSRERNQLWSKI